MRVIEAQSFTGIVVVMDESYFNKCTFDGCTLVYGGGDFGWNECRFMPNCRVTLGGTAARVYQFMKHVHMVKDPESETPLPPITDTSGYLH